VGVLEWSEAGLWHLQRSAVLAAGPYWCGSTTPVLVLQGMRRYAQKPVSKLAASMQTQDQPYDTCWGAVLCVGGPPYTRLSTKSVLEAEMVVLPVTVEHSRLVTCWRDVLAGSFGLHCCARTPRNTRVIQVSLCEWGSTVLVVVGASVMPGCSSEAVDCAAVMHRQSQLASGCR
jgi:hypothetical protein